jgi:uncharacterized protein (DUF433 family)
MGFLGIIHPDVVSDIPKSAADQGRGWRMRSENHRFNRITKNGRKANGGAYIRDSQIPVAAILSYLGSGKSVDEILVEWPELDREDIYQALAYAAWQGDDGRDQPVR